VLPNDPSDTLIRKPSRIAFSGWHAADRLSQSSHRRASCDCSRPTGKTRAPPPAISGPLTAVNSGQSRSRPDNQSPSSAALTARCDTPSKLVMRVRFPSSAPFFHRSSKGNFDSLLGRAVSCAWSCHVRAISSQGGTGVAEVGECADPAGPPLRAPLSRPTRGSSSGATCRPWGRQKRVPVPPARRTAPSATGSPGQSPLGTSPCPYQRST
jgi:hypothetical protein